MLVGDDPASQVYVRMKGKACEELGMRGETIRLPADTPEAELLALVDRLNAEFYSRFPYPWPPMNFTRLEDPGFDGEIAGEFALPAGGPGLGVRDLQVRIERHDVAGDHVGHRFSLSLDDDDPPAAHIPSRSGDRGPADRAARVEGCEAKS